MVSGGMRRILFVIGAGVLLLILLEAGVYNWRLVLSMRHKNLAELSKQLSWRRDELLVERATLLNPERLQQAGTRLGLRPVPLERFSICRLDAEVTGGDRDVCMEQ